MAIYRLEECHHDGVHVLHRRCLAFIDDDGIGWDFAEKMNDAPAHTNPWRGEADSNRVAEFDAERHLAMHTWDELPENNRAWLEEFVILPYEQIIDIDEHGDEWFDGPHLYVGEFHPKRGPFREHIQRKLQTIGRWSARAADPNPEARVNKIPTRSRRNRTELDL
jgi:hypothetical protein